MLHTIVSGEHTFALYKNAGDRFDIRGTAKVSIETAADCVDVGQKAEVTVNAPVRILFVWGAAVVHVNAEVGEIWQWGDSELFVHVLHRCIRSGGERSKPVVHCDVPGSLVILERHATAHASQGVSVRAYAEARVYAPAGSDVSLSGYAQWYLPDGSFHKGNRDTYRPGYIVLR